MATTTRGLLIQAVDELSDEAIQERLWARGERRSEIECGFDDAILVVIDELGTENPSELIGYALKNEQELTAFTHLQAALNALVAQTGPMGSYKDALAAGSTWTNCVDYAVALRGLLHT